MSRIREIIEKEIIEIMHIEKEKCIKRKHSFKIMQDTEKIGEYAILHGVKSYIQRKKLKLVHSSCKLYSDTEGLRIATEKEIEMVKGNKRIGKAGNSMIDFLSLYYPQVVTKGVYYDIYRIDIKRCFYSIYSRIGLDCRIKAEHENGIIKSISIGRGLYNKQNSQIITELENAKELRNSLYGLTRACRAYQYDPRRRNWLQLFMKGNLFNPELHAVIIILLHAFVSDILNVASVYYYNVDGGFIFCNNIQDVITVAEDYGFILEIEEVEEADIKGIGAYRYITGGREYESGHYEKVNLANNILRLYNIEDLKGVKKQWQKLTQD